MNVPGTVGTTAIRFDLARRWRRWRRTSSRLRRTAVHRLQPRSRRRLRRQRGGRRAALSELRTNRGSRGRPFSETQYLRNYGDLQAAFGTNDQAATAHYITNGINEGRVDDAPSPAQIDGLQYIASNADLIAAFGANAAAGQQHYASNGHERRPRARQFQRDPVPANYADLQAAFGNNTDVATAHYHHSTASPRAAPTS